MMMVGISTISSPSKPSIQTSSNAGNYPSFGLSITLAEGRLMKGSKG